MNTNDDSLLTSLLQYHTGLIDQPFVDKISNKIKANNKLRFRLMIVAIFLACLVAVPMVASISVRFDFLVNLPSLSPYIATFALLSTLGFGAWLTSEDF